jgi:hypothetical protein
LALNQHLLARERASRRASAPEIARYHRTLARLGPKVEGLRAAHALFGDWRDPAAAAG